MLRTARRRATFAALALLAHSLWAGDAVASADGNITLDDSHPSIVYTPAGNWSVNSTNCNFCLKPPASVAWERSWHFGLHILPVTDGDDEPGGKDNDSKRKRDDDNPFETSHIDQDDPGFVDTPVTVDFNFTGSAVYLFAIIPLGVAQVNSTPTFMNLSFTLDGKPAPSFMHQGSATASGFIADEPVLALSNLVGGPHSLHVELGADSVFMLDYIQVTPGNGSASTNEGVSSNSSSPSPGSTMGSSSHSNVATFAGAVGGATGFLVVASLLIAGSIIRRRMLARRRDRQWSSSHDSDTDSVDSSRPPMRGPVPFVPRYFPGTVPPPVYVEDATADRRADQNRLASPTCGPASLPVVAAASVGAVATSPLISPVGSPPPLISLASPEMRAADEPPSYLEHTRSPRIRPNDIPLLDIDASSSSAPAVTTLAGAGASLGGFDWGINGMNVPPPPLSDDAIATPAPAQPRPPPTLIASSRSSSSWLSRFTNRRQPSSSSLPGPAEAEQDVLMEHEDGDDIDSLHGI